MSSEQNLAILASPPMKARVIERPKASSHVLGGSLIMLIGTGVVSAFNFGYQVTMARALGPSSFGDISVVGTLLMLGSAITLSFQLVCAKFVARNHSSAGKVFVYSRLMKRAWIVGLLVAALLVIARSGIASLLRLNTP